MLALFQDARKKVKGTGERRENWHWVLKDNLCPLDRHHRTRGVAKGMGWTVLQTNGETGEREVGGGNWESVLGLGNWGKAGGRDNGQREGTGVNVRQASSRIPWMSSFASGSCSVTPVVSNSLRPYGLKAAGLLCPWDFPGKNAAVGCCALLQVTLPIQGSKLCLLYCRQILYSWATKEAHQIFKRY